MNVDDGLIHKVTKTNLLTEREIEITEEQALKILSKRGTILCKKCKTEIQPVKDATTGICTKCNPSSKVVEILPNGSYNLIRRQERRHPKGKRIRK